MSDAPVADHASPSSRTRTGTASGTRRSRRSGCGSCKLLDALLPMLESDLSYSRFLLDGQTAVLDDYLEVRPEAAADARSGSRRAGRLSIGPWMVLMDEFMVSGETMVRDLQFGIARGSELGGVMDVGYLPDMFGHVAQMPQLLRLAGFEHAVVWRGVPAVVEQTAFWWEAPDGSRVRAEYLYGSYSNGRDIPDDAKRLVAARPRLRARARRRRASRDMLLMNGTDHQMPQPWLGRVVAEANAMQDDYEFVVTSLPEYLADQPSTGLVTVTRRAAFGRAGEPADGRRFEPRRRAPGVRARPSARSRSGPSRCRALFLPAERVPARARRHRVAQARAEQRARLVVRVQQRRGRRPGARALLRGAPDRRRPHARRGARARRPGRRAARARRVVVNPTARARSGLVDARVPGHAARATSSGPTASRTPRSWSARSAATGFQTMVTGQKVRWVLDLMRGVRVRGPPDPRRTRSRRSRARPISTTSCCIEARGRRRAHRPRPS